MAVDVIALPPVGIVGSSWTVAAPVQRSRSLLTGRRYLSRWGRERREATLNISALSLSRSGAGYSEMLIRYLDGGANLVRLNSQPINWHLDQMALAGLRSSQALAWSNEGDPLAWEFDGAPLYWFTGTIVSGVAADGELLVSGLPANRLICRPGEFIRAFELSTDSEGTIVQATSEARSDADGVAVIKLFDSLPDGDYPRLNIGDADSRVFEALQMPSSAQPIGQNWFYQWNFREVFADEVGGFNEVNPW